MLIRAFLLAAALLLSGCAGLGLRSEPVQDTLTNSRESVALLLYGRGSCTAFHIGDGKFITAAHCFSGELGGPMKEIRLIDHRNFHYFPKVEKFDEDKDIVLLSTYGFKGPSLGLRGYGSYPKGMEIVAMGHPGYYGRDFQWEQGFVKDTIMYGDTQMIVSEEASYSGESGGPVVSTASGEVVGMVVAGVEMIQWYDFPMHSHVSLSLFVSSNEIRNFLDS
jgi:hypothetical protein